MSRFLRWLRGHIVADAPHLADLDLDAAREAVRSIDGGVVRFTPVYRRGEYVAGWRVRADSDEGIAALFVARFLPSDHTQSRRV